MRSKEFSEKKVDKSQAAKALQDDILNSTLHCFGSHHKCKPEYCKTVKALCSQPKNKSSPESNVSDDSPSSSADISLDNLSSSFTSSSDDPSTESPALHISSDETEDDGYLPYYWSSKWHGRMQLQIHQLMSELKVA